MLNYLPSRPLGFIYINLDSTVYAVITSPEGNVQVVKGGMVELLPGRYRLQYVDKKNRTKTLPKIEAVSSDGVTISLTATISFRVTNPLRVFEIQNPIDDFMSFIQANIRKYIAVRTSDEIKKDIDSQDIVGFILEKQMDLHVISKAFSIIEIVVEYTGQAKYDRKTIPQEDKTKGLKPLLRDLMKLNDGKLKVFLCHASQDKSTARELYGLLGAESWLDPWLDERNLLPGQDWNMEIEKAVESADVIIVFLSRTSVSKNGYIQKELRQVLDVALEKPEGGIFIIPVRLDDCEIPRRLRNWQYVDYFPKENNEFAYSKILASLKLRMR